MDDEAGQGDCRPLPRPFLEPRTAACFLAVVCFFCLSWVVYRDDPSANPQAFFELSEHGVSGLAVWRAKNCNTCHQLYGFGGYLGPDLTHIVRRQDEGAIRQIVRSGVGAMPASTLSDADCANLYSFLSEIDRSGQGHPDVRSDETWDSTFAAIRGSAGELPGMAVFQANGCGQCHAARGVGRVAAPDLRLATSRSNWPRMAATLRNGRGNMPAFAELSDLDVEDLLHLFDALASVTPTGRATEVQKVPWFNYVPRPDH